MAVTSIWRVHGSVGKVLDYVENAEKTTAVSTGDGDLSDVIDYAIQQRKTSQTQVRDGEEVVQRFVSGINCNPRTAKMEMQKIKKFYGKEDGVIAYHGYQSFAPGEATPELAHEIGVKLAQRLWGDRYQVLVATHLDRANHLHSHFVINTVSFVDGIKYHRTKQDYKEMQRVSDALCKEYGLSVIRNPKGRGKTYNEWIAEKEGKPTLRGVIRSDIDRAILASTTQQNFQEAMQAMGYTFKTRTPDGQPLKYPALKPPGAKGYFRFHRLGPGYSLAEILDRVYDNVRRQAPFPEADRMARQRNPFIPYPKAKGIHALYLRYCYELHIIQKHPASVKRVPYSMRQDLILLDNTSFVILDPKGELLRDTGHLLEEKGYVIKVLDLINPERSHCYNPFVYLRDDDDIQRLATNIMKNTTPKDSKSSDHFWEDMAAMLLKALISYLHYEAPPEEQNFPMVMDMIRAGDVKEDNEEYVSTLDELFERLERKNPEHIAVRYYKGYHSGSGKTLKSIQITLISHLEKFNLTSLAGITQTDEMELGEIGERKTAVFAVIPDSDSSYNFIVGMLYTQLFQQLYRKADFEHGGRLPVHVHFVMDEFANVALPDDFDKLLATMRSREISVSIILQNLAQLKALFDKQWESIVGNCDTFLYLGGNEQSTHEYVSKLLGKQTIDTNTYGQSKGRSGSYTTNFQTAGRELMTPDEVRMLDNRYALLFIRGERPVKDLKYNILKHPNVALTTDGQAAAYQHGTDPLSVAAVSINLEKLKQAIPEDTDTGDYVILTEEEVYDFLRKKAQENNQNQNSNYQEVTYEKHHPQHHSSHHPSDF